MEFILSWIAFLKTIENTVRDISADMSKLVVFW